VTDEAKELFRDFWPAKTCFRFNASQIELDLKKYVTPEAAKALVEDPAWNEQLRTCGKALFKSGEGKTCAIELSTPTQPARYLEVSAPDDVNTKTGLVPQ
jgi:hypothetical protein